MAGRHQTVRRMSMALAIGFAACAAIARAGELTVDIDGFEPGKGHVMVALFSSADGFPEKAAQGMRLDPTGKTVTAVFRNLPAGRYAVSAYHDENDNQRLDRGMLGIPKERYGFSEDARGFNGPPGFRDAAFRVDDAGARIAVHLR